MHDNDKRSRVFDEGIRCHSEGFTRIHITFELVLWKNMKCVCYLGWEHKKVLDWIGCQWNENFWHVNKAWLKEKSLKVSLSQQNLKQQH